MPYRFDEWLVRHDRFFVAPAEQHRRRIAVSGSRDLQGQTRLPDSGFAGDEREPPLARAHLAPKVREPLELRLPAHERPRGGAAQGGRKREGYLRTLVRIARSELERGILAQDRFVEPADRGARIDPELVGEQRAQAMEGTQRVGLPVGSG